MSRSSAHPLGGARLFSAHRAAGALICVAGLGLASCGGGSSFASQANSICTSYNAKANALPKPTTPSAFASYLDQATSLFGQGVAKMQALKPPSDKAAQFQQWIASSQQLLTALQQAQSAAHSGNVNQAVSIIQNATPINDKAKSQAKALGLTGCAK